MSNEWGSKWPEIELAIDNAMSKASSVPNDWLDVAYSPQSGVETIANVGVVISEINKLKSQLKSQGSNLVDTESYLYFQCDDCGEILDPHTKSFQALQEHRVNAGWACKWNVSGMGYKVYCTECNK